MAEGEFALVTQHLKTALERPGLPTRLGWLGQEHDFYVMLADVAGQQRDEAALRQFAPLAEDLAARHGHRLYQAIAHRARGVAHRLEDDHARAEARLNQALELFKELETQWQIGRTLHELGELAQARADLAGARDYFSRALLAFEEMGARPDAARTRAALAALES